MSLERAKEYLKKYGYENKIIEFEGSSATVKEAAEQAGCKEGEIAKTLSFLVNDECILIVTAGDKKINNSKFKQQFQTKAKMVPFDKVEELIGHAPGGVCPFGINEGIKVYLDESLKQYEYVHPACGSHNSAIKLSIEEIEKASNYELWIDVCN